MERQHTAPSGQRTRSARVGGVRPSFTWLLAAATGAATLFTGCQGAARPSPTVTTPTAPEPSRSYDDEEIAAYHEAVRRVEAFEVANQRILAAGKGTREARRFYEDRLRTWQPTYELLRSYQREGIRIARRPVVISTTATSVKSFQDNAAEVVLTRCTDQSDLGMTKAGVPLPAVHPEPVIQTVVVYRSENRTWRIGPFTTTDRPCR